MSSATHAAAAAAYAVANDVCSASAISSRKKTASAEPTSAYWIACNRTPASTSASASPAKVNSTKRKPYSVARCASA